MRARCTRSRCRASAASRSGRASFRPRCWSPPPCSGATAMVWLPGWAALSLVVSRSTTCASVRVAAAPRRARGRGAVVGRVAGRPGTARAGAPRRRSRRGSDRAGDRVVGQPLQLHGRQRRPRRDDGDRADSPPTRSPRGAWHAGAPAAPAVLRAAPAAIVPFLVVNLPPARDVHGRRRRGAARAFSPRRSASAASPPASWPAWFPAARVPAVRRRRDADARAPRARAASGCGRRIAATTTSACTSWAPAIAARSPSTRR